MDDSVIWENIRDLSKGMLNAVVNELSQEQLGHAKIANNARNAYSENPYGNNNNNRNNYRKNNNFRNNNNRNFNHRNYKK